MHPKEKNLKKSKTTLLVSEFHTKQFINEENSSLFMKSNLQKSKNKGRNLKSKKS
jgi:hypothetical protein